MSKRMVRRVAVAVATVVALAGLMLGGSAPLGDFWRPGAPTVQTP